MKRQQTRMKACNVLFNTYVCALAMDDWKETAINRE